jgi:hypothetical protein
MSEEQIIALLAEIRDLQKQSVESYKLALQKQQEAIDLQKNHLADFQKKVRCPAEAGHNHSHCDYHCGFSHRDPQLRTVQRLESLVRPTGR